MHMVGTHGHGNIYARAYDCMGVWIGFMRDVICMGSMDGEGTGTS